MNSQRQTTVTAARGKSFADTWSRFESDHADWLSVRSGENRIVYAFPPEVTELRLRLLYGLSDHELQAEQDFAVLCKAWPAVGVDDGGPIAYRWLRPEVPPPNDNLMRELGWTSEQIEQALELCGKADSVDARMASALGRLTCSPRFIEERNLLRTKWDALPEASKPCFPLHRSPRLPSAECVGESFDGAPLSASDLQAELVEFTAALDRFCDDWRITSFATWDLPDIDGPKWPDPLFQSTEAGRQVYDTPWHFPLQAADGLGSPIQAEHAGIGAEKGVDDHGSWQTYRQMFLIDFWEGVIRSRYPNQQQHGFVTKLLGFVADIVQLDTERVIKLRKTISAFRRGNRRSLAGSR